MHETRLTELILEPARCRPDDLETSHQEWSAFQAESKKSELELDNLIEKITAKKSEGFQFPVKNFTLIQSFNESIIHNSSRCSKYKK